MSRDTCFVYDLIDRTILKTAEIKLKERDAFPGDGYSYVEDDECYVVAGRYYVHRLEKQTLIWSVVGEGPGCVRSINKSTND